MRTSPVIIERVTHWLKYFTLPELIFVLEQDARMYPFDKVRVKKIALALRHTFASDQSDNEVQMLIEDLSHTYSQTRPVTKPTSITSITIRKSNHLLTPFCSLCTICSQNLNQSNARQKGIRLYCNDGSVVIGTMFTLHCNHVNASSRSFLNDPPITIFPNFICVNNRNIYTHQSLHFGRYVYVGGDVAVERGIIEKFIAHLVYHDISMTAYADILNQEALNNDHPQLMSIDRRLLSNIIQTFLVIQLYVCFGHLNVDTPCQLKDFSEWAWCQFPHLLSCFIYLWTNHCSIIGSCGEHCSKCLVVDGHQKTRRRICAFKDVKVNTQEMNNLVIGCCRTPLKSSHYCQQHSTSREINAPCHPESVASRSKPLKKTFSKYHNKSYKNGEHLNATSCRTLKARSDQYINKCTRSFGLIALISNCRIITSFSELYRSETLKEIINLFAVTFRVAGKLAPTLVYDDGCHLVRYVQNHIGHDLTKTPAMQILASTPISVDRSHFRNHVGKFCRQTMNPDKNPLLNNVNTQSAEQTFSWLKQYANIMSNMGHLRAPLFILMLFHLKNMSSVNKPPSSIFDIASFCPTVDAVSLCHLDYRLAESATDTVPNTSFSIQQQSDYTFRKDEYDLPKGTTDWDTKILEIINRNKIN